MNWYTRKQLQLLEAFIKHVLMLNNTENDARRSKRVWNRILRRATSARKYFFPSFFFFQMTSRSKRWLDRGWVRQDHLLTFYPFTVHRWNVHKAGTSLFDAFRLRRRLSRAIANSCFDQVNSYQRVTLLQNLLLPLLFSVPFVVLADFSKRSFTFHSRRKISERRLDFPFRFF